MEAWVIFSIVYATCAFVVLIGMFVMTTADQEDPVCEYVCKALWILGFTLFWPVILLGYMGLMLYEQIVQCCNNHAERRIMERYTRQHPPESEEAKRARHELQAHTRIMEERLQKQEKAVQQQGSYTTTLLQSVQTMQEKLDKLLTPTQGKEERVQDAPVSTPPPPQEEVHVPKVPDNPVDLV